MAGHGGVEQGQGRGLVRIEPARIVVDEADREDAALGVLGPVVDVDVGVPRELLERTGGGRPERETERRAVDPLADEEAGMPLGIGIRPQRTPAPVLSRFLSRATTSPTPFKKAC